MINQELVDALAPIVSRVRTSTCCVKKPGMAPARINQALTAAKLAKHCDGGPAYGVYPMLPGESTTRIALLDLDSHKGETPWPDMQAAALNIMADLESYGMRPIPFRSSGGAGLHIYLLWDTPQDAYSVRHRLRHVLAHSGFKDGTAGVAAGEIEAFPKQDSVPADGYGNMFVLPLAGKSVPLESFELDDMPKDFVIGMDWPVSDDVPLAPRPVREVESVGTPTGITPTIRSALDAILNSGDDELDYDGWRTVLFAINFETGGSDEGLALAHEFSARSSKYDADKVERDWNYAGRSDAAPITGRSILHLARELHKWQEPVEDDFEVVENETAKGETWLTGWHFLTARDRLAKVGEPGTLSITGFNTRFARMMAAGKNGGKPAAFETVKNGPGFPIAADLVYAAGQEPVFEFNGMRYLNAYRESSTPAPAADYTDGGRAAVDLVRAHIRMLTGDDETAHMVETWIALNVRAPGQLMGVSLLVKGVQGDGKTILFRQLMATVMGAENVGDVANAEVRSQFSGWAVGRALRVVEELKAPGHNRHDVLNSVKPYITNPTISVHRKGQDGFDALNTTNYVCLTNYEDALPIDDTDRRWWVIFSPFTSITDVVALVGPVEPYFDRLTTAIRAHGTELRKYFMECPLHARIRHNMRAPETAGRARMIRAENDMSGGDFLDGYLRDGAYGISGEVVASAELTRQLHSDMGDDHPRTKQIAALLASRGFKQCDGTLKWDGRNHRVYVHDARLVTATGNELGRQRLRKMLDETAKNNEHAEFDDLRMSGTADDLM
jgi:hypothetical protein